MRQRYFKGAIIVCYWYFQSYSPKQYNCYVHFVFVGIFQNIGNRALSLSKSCFSFQKPSNEHMMSSVRQLWNFNLKGLPTPWGLEEGDQNSKKSHRIWSAYFWHGRSPYICLPACTAIEVLFGTLFQCSGWYWWIMYVWSWRGPPKWHPMSFAFRTASSSYQRNKIKQQSGRRHWGIWCTLLNSYHNKREKCWS